MMNPLGYLKWLFSFLTLSIESKFPSTRRALSTSIALIAIIAIIGVGGVLIYILVVSTGPTSSTYP